MKLVRFKLAGLGLVAAAGSTLAASDDWLPAPTAAPALPAKPAEARPPVVPQRVAPVTPVIDAPEPIWKPSKTPLATPAPITPPSSPTVVVNPQPKPESGIGEWRPASPMMQLERPSPRQIRSEEPYLPPTASLPEVPKQPVQPMPPPVLPGTIRPQPSGQLPPPRPSGSGSGAPDSTPAPCDLPVAPPELMNPDCAPGRHGAFGSAPIRLGRDYPPLSDLCGRPVRDWFASRFGADRALGSGGFLQGEYLLWWMPGVRVPILGTTNPDPNAFGFIGEPGTTTLLGPGEIIGPSRQGFRVRGGLWLDECATCGIDGSVFFLGKRTADASFYATQYGVITRPIFSPNIRPGFGMIGQTGEAVTVPNVLGGGLSVNAESYFWGADVNLRHCLLSGCDWKLMGFLGYRYLDLSEEVSVTENIVVIGTSPRIPITDPIGTTILVRDTFRTENQFNGGQVGLTYERRRGRWSLDGRASVAFGVTHQELEISGVQVRTRPGQLPATFQGGLLAAGPNLGKFTRDEFSVVPEFTLNLGYWATESLKLYVGYNFLYWPNVIRPGDQIDGVVDLSFVPNAPPVPPSGQLRPAPLFKQSDLWVTGLQFGVEWRW